MEAYLWVYIGEAPYQSRYYPRYLLSLAMVLTFILLITSLNKKQQEEIKGPVLNKQVFVTMMGTVLYIVSLNYLGFSLATLIYIFFIMFYLGMRNKLALVLVPTLTTLFAYIVFNRFLMVLLPEGIFFGG